MGNLCFQLAQVLGFAGGGALVAAMPLGIVCAVVLYGRFTSPARRWRLVLAGYGAGFQLALKARFMRDVPASPPGSWWGRG